MACNFAFKRGDEQLVVTNSHEPLIVSLLFNEWKDREDWLFSNDYSLIECSFAGAKNNIEHFSFSQPKAISAEEFEKVTKNVAMSFELKDGHWVVLGEEEEKLLGEKLIEEGLADIFGMEFYEMLQNEVSNYQEKPIQQNRF